MNATLRQLRSFVSVAQAGSFTRAAGALHISQPALSVQIRELENNFGVKLFERTSRTVQLTPAGRDLAPVFKKLLGEFDAAMETVQKQAATRRETIRIACVPSLATTVLPELISDYRRRHPLIEVVLKDVVWKRVLGMVRAEEVDFGIAPHDQEEKDLHATKLMEDRMHVLFPARHPLARLRVVTLEQVSRYPLVLTGKDSNVRSALDAAFAARGEMAAPVSEVSQAGSAVGLVRAGLGVTILPSTTLELRSDPTLRSKPIRDCIRRVSLLRKPTHELSAAGRKLVAQLKIRFARVGAGER